MQTDHEKESIKTNATEEIHISHINEKIEKPKENT